MVVVIGIIFTAFLGIAVFLYIFWRKLKEDYPSSQIFTTAFYMLLGLGLSLTVTLKLAPTWWFWGAAIGVLAGLGIGTLRYKLRFYESFEALVIGLLPWLSFVFLVDSVETTSIVSFFAFFMTVILIGLYTFVDRHYKNFSWYKSGRVGFSGLTTAAVFFLIRALVASFLPDVVSFENKFEVFISSIAAFGLFLLTYNLSRQKV
jgi:hypothetical protein